MCKLTLNLHLGLISQLSVLPTSILEFTKIGNTASIPNCCAHFKVPYFIFACWFICFKICHLMPCFASWYLVNRVLWLMQRSWSLDNCEFHPINKIFCGGAIFHGNFVFIRIFWQMLQFLLVACEDVTFLLELSPSWSSIVSDQ